MKVLSVSFMFCFALLCFVVLSCAVFVGLLICFLLMMKRVVLSSCLVKIVLRGERTLLCFRDDVLENIPGRSILWKQCKKTGCVLLLCLRVIGARERTELSCSVIILRPLLLLKEPVCCGCWVCVRGEKRSCCGVEERVGEFKNPDTASETRKNHA